MDGGAVNGRFEFAADVAEAVADAKREAVFDGTYVVNVSGYLQALINSLDKKDICGYWDGAELQVKRYYKFDDPATPN